MKAAVSWSGGKDACLAWIRAREHGATVATFMTMCDEDGISKSHALPAEFLQAQAQAAGVAWRSVPVPPRGYAAAFDAALAALRAEDHTHLVFGDIDLQAHRDWLEPACRRAGLEPWFPLWGRPRALLAREVVDAGIRARLVCVDTRWLDERFAGADYGTALLAQLPDGVCPVGEDGEFHTFVHDAPGFAAPLPVRTGPRRRVASQPPYTATTFVLATPEWA
jgi:uncharacterized protein (TIGR00290 family)